MHIPAPPARRAAAFTFAPVPRAVPARPSARRALLFLAAFFPWAAAAQAPSTVVPFPGEDPVLGRPDERPPRRGTTPRPPRPALQAPISTEAPPRPVFAWSAPIGDARYRIQAIVAGSGQAIDQWLSADALGCSEGGSVCRFRPGGALAPGRYGWRVRARDGVTKQNGPWTPWAFFDVPALAAFGSGLDFRPANRACRLPEPPPSAFAAEARPSFPGVILRDAVILLSSPSDGRVFAVERHGRVVAFDGVAPVAGEPRVFLDIRDRTLADTGETGLLGLAFHPRFPEDPRAFVFYTNLVDGAYVSYLSEFRTRDGGATLDPASEREVLTVTGHLTHNHKGGTVAFGPDGHLYAGLGDGGNRETAQDPFSFFGSLLRIDVDGARPYAIPPDNPFADGLEGAPEVYAYGLRNPWRWSFHPDTGEIWLTDVGHTRWEEINIIEPGGNYGWPHFEGPECIRPGSCEDPDLLAPLHAYPHDATGGIVIVGGFIYRGSAFPELREHFVFADGTDRVWALAFEADGTPAPRLLIDGGLEGTIIRSLYEDPEGELHLVKGSLVYRLAPDLDAGDENFPLRLSETGCVDPDAPQQVASGLVPYAVNTAFWTDGAAKSRWLALPDDGQITVDEDGDFHFPAGSVLVKEFRLGDRRVETRLFARHDDGRWAGYSYAWNEDQTDALLVEAPGRSLDVAGQRYTIPSRNDCLTCHTAAAGRALGLEVPQLNRSFHYEATGRSANQLETLALTGLLDGALPAAPAALPAFPALGDPGAPLSDRARAYLHANCSSCHRPDGGGRGPGDLRFQALATMDVCDVVPEVGDFGIPNARLLAPGDPDRSVLSARLQALGPGAMPPIGKNRVDVEAAAVLDEFIAGLERCPPVSGPLGSPH